MSLLTLDDLLKKQVQDIFSAEQQIEEALPKMISAAHSDQLRKAFQMHLDQTHDQADRISRVMDKLGLSGGFEKCKGMAGLIEEGEEILSEQADPAVRDAALISAAQRVEHYEIAAYGSACTFAESLHMGDVKDLLGQNLEQEKKTDKKLTSLATGGVFSSGINKEARKGR